MTTQAVSGTARPRRDDVRAAVIAAASELFSAQGYGATTLGDIAAAAGFTKGAIYSNFGGKPELFAATLAGRFRHRAGGAVRAAALLGEGRTADLARQLAEITVSDLWSTQQVEFAQLARTDAAIATVYAEIRRSQVAELADRLGENAAALSLASDVDLDAAAVLLITTLGGLAVEHTLNPEAMTTARIEAVYTQLLRGLRP